VFNFGQQVCIRSLKAKYHKLCAQVGSKKKARMAIAHKLALIVYQVLGHNIAVSRRLACLISASRYAFAA
jgi:hypothetical protein